MFSFRRFAFRVLAPLSLATAYLFGAWSFANEVWPIRALRDARRAASGEAPLANRFDALGRLTERAGQPEIACPARDDRTAVILFIGQSIQSNTAGQRAESAHGDRVLSWFDGHCRVARSPLPGSTDAKGEALTPFGDGLVAAGIYDRVILVPSAIGGTTIARWAPGGDLNAMLAGVVAGVSLRYRLTHVVWHQGEDDFAQGTSGDDYTRRFGSVLSTLRAGGVDAPVYVSVATRCDDDGKWRADNAVARAQRALPDPALGVRPGVDTDALLEPGDRYDDCHLGASGVAKYAAALVDIFRR